MEKNGKGDLMRCRMYDKTTEDCLENIERIVDRMDLLVCGLKVLQGNLEQELKELGFLIGGEDGRRE